MALKKTIDTAVGAPAEYWKFSGMEYRYSLDGVSGFRIEFEIFVSEQKRRENFLPLDRRSIHLTPSTIPAALVDFTNPAAMAYNIAKTAPELAGAEDC